MQSIRDKYFHIVLICIFAVSFFLSIFKIAESPPTWMDEGIIISVARNMYDKHDIGIQVAKDISESASLVTTGPTVTIPIFLSFSIFGIGLIQARFVMVIFILAFLFFVYLILRRLFGKTNITIFSLLLISTFPPLYGNGKNVLGEVPGLFFMALLFYFLLKFKDRLNKTSFLFLMGIMCGLIIITKPIFILLIPALILAYILLRIGEYIDKHEKISNLRLCDYIALIIGAFLPIFLWYKIQIAPTSLTRLFSVYSNPHSVSFIHSIWENIRLIFHDFQPLYCVLTLILFIVTIIQCYRHKIKMSFVYLTVVSFSVLIFLAFLRMPAYYRYFFLAQTWGIIFIIPNLNIILNRYKYKKIVLSLTFAGILSIHLYTLFFRSWVAHSFQSNRTKSLIQYFESMEIKDKIFFIYQAPELVTFIKNKNYYQYVDLAKNIPIGKDSLKYIDSNNIDYIATNASLVDNQLFKNYTEEKKIDRYIILKKK